MMGAKPANVQRLGDAFVAGVFWGAAIIGISNGLWGGCNWGGGNVNINVNKFNNPDEGWKLSTP